MEKIMRIVIAALALANVWGASNAAAQQTEKRFEPTFDCGFVSDRFKEGKSTNASCSYNGEAVFSVPASSYRFPANEHCKTEIVFSYNDLTSFVVDLQGRTVQWEEQHGLAPFAVPEMVSFYMKEEKITEKEAKKKVAQPGLAQPGPSKHFSVDIKTVQHISETHYADASGQMMKPPKILFGYLITFGDPAGQYSLYIPSSNNNVILSKYVSDMEHSWVNLRFGKCQKRE
jgi:hypothetical protein